MGRRCVFGRLGYILLRNHSRRIAETKKYVSFKSVELEVSLEYNIISVGKLASRILIVFTQLLYDEMISFISQCKTDPTRRCMLVILCQYIA